MRVVVNRLATLGPKTGIGHYTAELLRCLPLEAGADLVDCFPAGLLWRVRQLWALVRPGWRSGSQSRPVSAAKASCYSPAALLRSGRAAVLDAARGVGRQWMTRQFRAAFLDRPCDLYHEPNLLPLPCDRPTLATIHDLSALLHPEWHPRERLAEYERLLPRAVERCLHFLTVSEFTRQEMIRTLGIPPGRVTRVYNGVRPGLVPLPPGTVSPVLHRLGLPPRYLLHVGTLEPRKNLDMLLRAYCTLPERLRVQTPLLLVGSWGWKADRLAEFLNIEARHRGVVHVGYVPDRYLAALYSGARALVYPSWYEGFGLPPLEMFACGGPVLASTAGALVETLGGRAHHLDPNDADAWHHALRRVLEDDDWREELRRGVVEVARPFTWERCAAETWRVYRRVKQLPLAA